LCGFETEISLFLSKFQYRYSTGFEKFLLFIAGCACLVSGASMPVMVIFFGRISQAMIDYEMDGSEVAVDYCPQKTTTEATTSSV
jgi:hypothetical protein